MTRRWFQVHLSTAIVMMFVVPTIAYLNIRPSLLTTAKAFRIYTHEYRGWLFEAYSRWKWSGEYGTVDENGAIKVFAKDEIYNLALALNLAESENWDYLRLGADIIIGLSCLVLSIILSERWIGRTKQVS
jgi:hypothetical protein